MAEHGGAEALAAGRQALQAADGAAESEPGKPHARSWSDSDGDGAEGDEGDGGMAEALEELILDAYNSMQSDGEFIFLPDHVARKLHEAAQLLQAEEPSPEPTAASSAASDTPETAGKPTGAAGSDRQPLQVVTRAMLPRTRSSELLFTDLAPVIETDEEESSGPSSPAGDREDKADSLTTSSSSSSAQPLPPPPPPVSSTHSTSSRSHTAPLHHTKTHAASPTTTPRTADKKEGESTYEKRRLAALKLKEDKARRAQEKHDAAKKQREDARRELEEVQRKEMEEKRERVRRMRQQREQRKASTVAKPAR